MISKRTFLGLGLLMASYLISSYVCFAEQSEQPGSSKPAKETSLIKEAEGKVSGLSSRFIAVETGVDAKAGANLEMAFKVDKNTQIVHKKSIKEISMGDIVKLSYLDIS